MTKNHTRRKISVINTWTATLFCSSLHLAKQLPVASSLHSCQLITVNNLNNQKKAYSWKARQVRDLLWSSSPSNKEKKKKCRSKKEIRQGKEEQDGSVLGVLKTWIGGQRGQHMEPTTREDSPLHAFLMHFPTSHCSCREQFHIYKVYSHFAIAFLTVLAPRVRRDQYIQYALFHRLNFFFFPKRMDVFILHSLNSVFKGAFCWSWQHKKPSRTE